VKPPEEVRLLAQRRQEARAAREFDVADALRHDIARLGWEVRDLAAGFSLSPRDAYDAWSPLLPLDTAQVHVLMETSTVLTGDALTPLLDAMEEPGVSAAGWWGVDVDLADVWRSFYASGPGGVDALLGYLLAVRREAALAAGVPDPRARTYRNADLEMSLALRAQGGRLIVPSGELPVHQGRHRGYHDTDPQVRDREARRTYERLLARFRGREEILAPRGRGS
jgi:hypothetical protein